MLHEEGGIGHGENIKFWCSMLVRFSQRLHSVFVQDMACLFLRRSNGVLQMLGARVVNSFVGNIIYEYGFHLNCFGELIVGRVRNN